MPKEHTIANQLPQLIKLVNNSEIASIQKVVTEIISCINDPNSSAKHLKDVIELDPPLASKVLQRANSAFFARSREISEILEAIIWIGFDGVKELALNQTVSQIFQDSMTFKDYSPTRLWKHSVAVAICGKMIYRREFGERGDNIYAAGLLHNIGIIIENQFMQDEFQSVLEKKYSEEIAITLAEQSIFGFTHAQIGEALTKEWALPDELTAAIAYHHLPTKASSQHLQIASAVYLADRLCQQHEIGFCESPEAENDRYVKQIMKEYKISREAIELIMDEVLEKIVIMQKEGWF